jgi:hypothetical protein
LFGNKNGQIQSASKLFNEASDCWRQRQSFILTKDDEKAKKACLEVIRLCQLSIQKYEMKGDAYVLLSNALSVAADQTDRRIDQDRYEFLQSRAAAVLQQWYTLPHRDYPTTKNTAIGEQLWRMMVDEIKKDKSLSEEKAIALMELYKKSLAAETISPNSFEKIKVIILGTPPTSRVEQTSQQQSLESSQINLGKTATTKRTMLIPPKITDLPTITDELAFIGVQKSYLPLDVRGWVNESGLYVQLNQAGTAARLQAGGKYRSCFDAMTDNFLGAQCEGIKKWNIRRFDKKEWDTNFAQLVFPAHEIVGYLSGNPFDSRDFSTRCSTDSIKDTVEHFKQTGEWTGLIHKKCVSCFEEISIWQYAQEKVCPYCGNNMGNIWD